MGEKRRDYRNSRNLGQVGFEKCREPESRVSDGHPCLGTPEISVAAAGLPGSIWMSHPDAEFCVHDGMKAGGIGWQPAGDLFMVKESN